VRCHRWEEIQAGLLGKGEIIYSQRNKNNKKDRTKPAVDRSQNLLDLNNVDVHFEMERSLADLLSRRPPSVLKAVNGIDLSIPDGTVIGLVGESGSGKTTLARAVIGLEKRTDGEIKFSGKELPVELSERDFETLKNIQIVFQNPDEALNPYLSVGASIRIPIQRLLSVSHDRAEAVALQLLESVQLSGEFFQQMPHQLSGGEKQRAALARSFASNPRLLLADEPVSSLDVSVQAAVLNLLDELQVDMGNSLLFISHDLAVVGYMADVVAVIYLGKLMELTRVEELFSPPYHPYTEALLSAIPIPDPAAAKRRIRLGGEVPSPTVKVSGCPFHTRCPRILGDICRTSQPKWQVDQYGNRFYCHIPLEELENSQDYLLD
jgi:peptide/nickel transport system ATP-binding protein